MKTLFYNPDQSWLAGSYVIDNQKVEINTSLPYISVEGYRTDFFAQGESANEIITEIHKIWISRDLKLTIEEAILRLVSCYL